MPSCCNSIAVRISQFSRDSCWGEFNDDLLSGCSAHRFCPSGMSYDVSYSLDKFIYVLCL